MKVTLISHTQNAETLLLFTKQTRLSMSPGLMDEIRAWPQEKKLAELQYMARTIKSSWEFISTTFLIEGVTRAVAQQITRTRQASYAMQSQRVTDARSILVTNGTKKGTDQHEKFEAAVAAAKEAYSGLVDAGVPLEDARGILPMNTQCNLVAKYNFRSLTDLVKARKSLRAQGEYNEMVVAMEAAVVAVWPWSEPFFKSDKQIAIELLEATARRIGIEVGKGEGWEIAKAIDLIRKD